MTINDVFSNAAHQIAKLSRHRDVVIGIQRTIKLINNRHKGLRDTKKIITAVDAYTGTFTFAAAGKTINDDGLGNFTTLGFTAGDEIWFSGTGALNIIKMTIVSIQNDAATNDQITVSEVIVNDSAISGVLAGFTLLSEVSYNHLTGDITMGDDIKESQEIFADDSELDVVDLDQLAADATLETYTPLGRRKFRISSDVLGSDISVMGWYDITNISASTRTTVIDVPSDYEEIIQEGVIYFLTSMPQYKDEFINKEAKEKFYSMLQLLRDEQEVAFHTPKRDARNYYN